MSKFQVHPERNIPRSRIDRMNKRRGQISQLIWAIRCEMDALKHSSIESDQWVRVVLFGRIKHLKGLATAISHIAPLSKEARRINMLKKRALETGKRMHHDAYEKAEGKELIDILSQDKRIVRQKVFERDGYKCVKCGSMDKLSYDHIIPECKGGPYTVFNGQTLCVSCNNKKGGKTISYLPAVKLKRKHV